MPVDPLAQSGLNRSYAQSRGLTFLMRVLRFVSAEKGPHFQP